MGLKSSYPPLVVEFSEQGVGLSLEPVARGPLLGQRRLRRQVVGQTQQEPTTLKVSKDLLVYDQSCLLCNSFDAFKLHQSLLIRLNYGWGRGDFLVDIRLVIMGSSPSINYFSSKPIV